MPPPDERPPPAGLEFQRELLGHLGQLIAYWATALTGRPWQLDDLVGQLLPALAEGAITDLEVRRTFDDPSRGVEVRFRYNVDVVRQRGRGPRVAAYRANVSVGLVWKPRSCNVVVHTVTLTN